MSREPYEHREYPEKAWSISRMKVIKSCLREYYFQYYGAHNGWSAESKYESKVAWRLKKLTNIWMLFGSKLHKGFKETIKFKDKETLVNINSKYVQEYVRRKLNDVVRDSVKKSKTGEWDEYPKGEMLQEYYYGEVLHPDMINEIKERIKICVDNFFNSKTYNDIFNKNCKVLENDEESFNSFQEHGTKVYALIDTLYVDEDGNFVIVDWKTGNYNEEDKEQLLVYAMYVMDKYNVPLDKIRGRVEYLLGGEPDEYEYNYEEIEYMKKRIEQDLNVINAFLEDSTVNRPMKKMVFIKTEIKNKCNRCKFKRLCEEEELRNEIN